MALRLQAKSGKSESHRLRALEHLISYTNRAYGCVGKLRDPGSSNISYYEFDRCRL